MEADMLQIKVEMENDFPVIYIRGEVDFATTPKLREVLELLLKEYPGKLSLDMSEVTFLDSEGIRTILYADAEIGSRGGVLSIRRCSGIVKTVFQAVKIERYLEFCNEDMEG